MEPDFIKGYQKVEVAGLEITLKQIADMNYRFGGVVFINSQDLPKSPEQKIGLGIAKFLTSIPEQGLTLESLSGFEGEHKKKWVLEELVPRGLVRETEPDSGIYVVTDAAKNASYLPVATRLTNEERILHEYR